MTDTAEKSEQKIRRASPSEGGCWFCCCISDQMAFDWEYDTYVHIECIIKALKETEEGGAETEAEQMRYLLPPKKTQKK